MNIQFARVQPDGLVVERGQTDADALAHMRAEISPDYFEVPASLNVKVGDMIDRAALVNPAKGNDT